MLLIQEAHKVGPSTESWTSPQVISTDELSWSGGILAIYKIAHLEKNQAWRI